MATSNKNLSVYRPEDIPNAKQMRFAIVVSDWNSEITNELCRGCTDTLIRSGALKNNIDVTHVPGSFELTLAAQWLAESEEYDAIICLGCVIQGETRHFDFICQSVTQGITQLNMVYNIPVVFGVLTTNTFEQAKDRAGGKHGNKGDEAAITAIKMSALKKEIRG